MAYTVLLVDDSDTIREAMVRAFAMAKLPMHEILRASNGAEALEVLKSRWVDMVLTDLNMPTMGGEELVMAMKADSEFSDHPRRRRFERRIEGAPGPPEGSGDRGISAQALPTRSHSGSSALRTGRMDMSVTLLTTASRIFPKMLEDTAFLFSEEPESSLVFDKAPVGIGIAYTGPEEGELRVWAQPSFMRVLAANMLGIDESDPNVESRCMDALGELLNIVLRPLLDRTIRRERAHDDGTSEEPR